MKDSRPSSMQEQAHVGVGPEFAAAAFRTLPVQVFQQGRGGTKQHGVTGKHGGVTEILGNHRFAQTVAAHHDEVARFAKKVECQRALDNVALDLGGPGPIEIGHGLEAFDSADPQTALQTAARDAPGNADSPGRESSSRRWRQET